LLVNLVFQSNLEYICADLWCYLIPIENAILGITKIYRGAEHGSAPFTSPQTL